MPLPAIAAVVARVAASGAAKTVAKTAVKGAAMKSFTGGGSTHPSYPSYKGSTALSQNQFPESPPWGSTYGGIGTPEQ